MNFLPFSRGKIVERHNFIAALHKRINQMGADETCSARDQRSNQGNLRDKDWRNYGPTGGNQTLY